VKAPLILKKGGDFKMESPIKKLRESHNMNQGEFALVLGFSKTVLSDLENGHCQINPKILAKLASLGIDVDELVKQHEEFMDNKRKDLTARFKSK
jgi:transcriptional regulator with XRE-family HTH domain